MKPLKMFPLILSILFFFTLAAVTACQAADPLPEPSYPFPTTTPVSESLILAGTKTAHLRGEITASYITEGQLLGDIFVDGRQDPTSTPGGDQAEVRIAENTRIFMEKDGESQIVTADELEIGMKVAVLFTGLVLESYPLQGTAAEILVLPQN